MESSNMIPYGRQSIDNEDIQSVVNVLKSDWITTGPVVEAFEEAFADYVGTEYAVAVSSGTAALHAAMYAIGIGPGDEVMVPPVTFPATANAIVYQQGIPVFCDVDKDALLIDPRLVEEKITLHTKAIMAVDYTGHPCDYDSLRNISERHSIPLIADACHALGATYKGRRVGSLADLSTFSFHPVKHITTGEGGMVTTNNREFAQKMRRFRNHGITPDHRQRSEKGSWFYEMVDLGYNYRITDIQCALGLSQLRKLPQWLKRRQEIARRYDAAFSALEEIEPLVCCPEVTHAYHLYVIRLNLEKLGTDRSEIFSLLRSRGIGVNVHYIPVHLHPYYRERFGYQGGECPVAEKAYEQVISLPIFPGISERNIADVINTITQLTKYYSD